MFRWHHRMCWCGLLGWHIVVLGMQREAAAMSPSEALKHILTLVEASAELKDDTQRKVLVRGVVVVAQKGLGVAPDGVAECEPNVLMFPTR
jgi:hypothetical protein